MATIHHHEDLEAWQLASELKKRVLQLIKRPAIAKHFRFCDQIRDSSRSGPANLAEGFWHYRPRENARCARIALGSLGETANHLYDAFTEKYIEEDEYRELDALARRALKTAIGWHKYLESCPDKPNTSKSRGKKPNAESTPERRERKTGNRKRKTENGKPRTENREPRTENLKPKT